jgi:hypothetical protein
MKRFIIIFMVILVHVSEAYVKFMPNEQLVETSEYIVVVRVEAVSDTGKVMRWRGGTAKILKNELKIVEWIKGSFSLQNPFVLNTLKFNGWMEDNIELPAKGSHALLFLKRDKNGKIETVNGIQGIWKMKNGEFTNIGLGSSLVDIKEIVQKQTNQIKESCSSKRFNSLLDRAEIQTQAGRYREALEVYKRAYSICPMRDLEEQMAWLLGEIGE